MKNEVIPRILYLCMGQMPTLGQCTVLPFSDSFVRGKIYSCKFLNGGLIVTKELRLASHIY